MALLRSFLPSPSRNLDLLGLFVIALVAHPLVPLGHWLARDDLIPWMTACLVAIALLRSSSLGDPPHPSLTQRPGQWWERYAAVLAPTATPVALMAWYEMGRLLGWPDLGAALLLTLGVSVVGYFGYRHRATAWNPHLGPHWTRWLIRIFLTSLLMAAHGLAARLLDGNVLNWLPVSGYIGLQFHSLGLVTDRLEVRRQRRASGRRDGRSYRPPLFRYVLAVFGPGAGLAILALMHHALIGPVTFEQGVVIAVHLLAWTAVLWSPSTPVAVSCMLHEVLPHGGAEKEGQETAVPFDRPPEGALRINPLLLQRLRVLHHWIVPVRDPRLGSLDDPIRPLWDFQTPFSYHVLGDASFEPERDTQRPQWERITIRLTDQNDIQTMGEASAQQRRLVVLRAFPALGEGWRRDTRTYRWESSVPATTLQVVDATTKALDIRNGDVIVLSIEGVARAFEVEIGCPIYDYAEFGHQRAAQLEDYVSSR